MTRIGIALGAGGITGIAWLLGALEGLREGTDWDPSTADVLSGTSAGAVAATVLATGAEPRSLLAMAERQDLLDAEIALALAGREAPGRRLPWPGSLALGLAGLTSPDPRHRMASLAGFLPRGPRPAHEIRGLTREAVSGGWPAHTTLLLHATDYATGRLVTFGGRDAPPAPLADAVVASCAVPGYYPPVRIGGRDYIDGGLVSFTHAGALAASACDVVLCLSPFAARRLGALVDTALLGAARQAMARQLHREVAALRAAGTRVAVIEPTTADLRLMGVNPMARGRARQIWDSAAASVAGRLDELLDGIDLPGGAHGPDRLAA